MRIIAIGGGGFTHGTFPELEEFCLAQCRCARPRIAYIGTASRDDPQKIARFKARFAGLSAEAEHVPMTVSAADLADRLAGIDLVYVGGGNTEEMVAGWRHSGWDKVLGAACRNGATLAGVSAGAVCWFETFLYSSGRGAMRPLAGLGLIPLGACPHYSTEPERRAALHEAVATGQMPPSIALDDGVAVAFQDGRPVAICRAETGADAYLVSRSEHGVVEAPLSLG